MNPLQVTVQGTIRADGTLELDDKVSLPAGRVLVTVRPLVPPNPDDPFWALMESIWAAQRARGHVPRSVEEVEAERRAIREESEEEIQESERIHRECEEARRPPGQAE